MASERVIELKNLTKKYGANVAVNSIAFEVYRGEVFGLLGENGAGKTTTLEMIEGLRRPTAGSITILGHDAADNLSEIKEKIGVQLQSSAYYNYLNLFEILDLFGSFYEKRLEPMELLKMVELEEKSRSLVGNLSGGQKQRFSIVASLVNDPEIVFLDEPTTGLDPVARRRLWDIIAKIKERGKTIILTTHYMEEAEILCDRIAIMEKGQIVAVDNTHRLIESTPEPIKISFVDPKLSSKDKETLEKLGTLKTLTGKGYHFEITFSGQGKMSEALNLIQSNNPESLTIKRASLEDAFIHLTGKNIAQNEGEIDA
jgi:ABC-2 type transport system ATP-binding protein